jgi:hypothetical protein
MFSSGDRKLFRSGPRLGADGAAGAARCAVHRPGRWHLSVIERSSVRDRRVFSGVSATLVFGV